MCKCPSERDVDLPTSLGGMLTLVSLTIHGRDLCINLPSSSVFSAAASVGFSNGAEVTSSGTAYAAHKYIPIPMWGRADITAP